MKASRSIAITVRSLTVAFLVLYLVVLSVSYIPNGFIHCASKSFAVNLVEKKYDEAREQARESQITGQAEEAIRKWLPEQADRLDALGVALDILDGEFRNALNEFLAADVIDEKAMRSFYRAKREEFERFRIGRALQGEDYVKNWIRVKYFGTILGLKREIRHAAYWNLAIFSLIFFISFRNSYRVYLPAFVAMAAAAFFSIHSYLFRTDWLLKILHGDFGSGEYWVFYSTTLFFLAAALISDKRASAGAG